MTVVGAVGPRATEPYKKGQNVAPVLLAPVPDGMISTTVRDGLVLHCTSIETVLKRRSTARRARRTAVVYHLNRPPYSPPQEPDSGEDLVSTTEELNIQRSSHPALPSYIGRALGFGSLPFEPSLDREWRSSV